MNHRANKTQQQVSDETGISKPTLISIEQGKNCKLNTYKKYLNACGKELVVIPKREG